MSCCQSFPRVNTEPKLNVNETFRRRPGHLLNVLCTFSLRPVTTELLYAISLLLYSYHFGLFHVVYSYPNAIMHTVMNMSGYINYLNLM